MQLSPTVDPLCWSTINFDYKGSLKFLHLYIVSYHHDQSTQPQLGYENSSPAPNGLIGAELT